MCPAWRSDLPVQAPGDPYERFILQHLRHYGLFTARSASPLRTGRWAGRRDSLLTGIQSPDGNETDEEMEPERTLYTLQKEALRTRQLFIDINGSHPNPRLREPLGLFAVPSTLSSFPAVRWPIECEVIKENIRHMEWDPPEAEPFYQFTGHERTPMAVGEEKGNIVFCSDSATKTPYFTGSRVGGSRKPLKTTTFCAKGQRDSALEFESRFESGNLQKAVQVGLHEYELTLRHDLYTTKHTQWFYFRVKKVKAGVTYRFTIINLLKSNSLYNAGMRPLLYSERAAKEQGEGWKRVGANIKYYRNNGSQDGKALYSLTWTLEFPHEGDTYYLAHCYPYTYSDLQHYLQRVACQPTTAGYCKLRVLCRSLAGNAVYILTVTAPSMTREQKRAKRAVVVTARVHPGETNSSWMMQGFLDFLLGDSPDACLLRETFVFKVVPMLNPDGVVVGNYRCSLSGRDLNRNYHSLLREAFPCIWHTRNMVKRLLTERDVVLYCDFHGHSRKNNVFMYGCESKDRASVRFQDRVFALMMSKNATDKFSFRSCRFKVHKSKEGTGRVVMWRLGIKHSYTMESTFGGSTLGGRSGTHFTTRDLKSMGYYFCDTLLDYYDPDPTKISRCLSELEDLQRQEMKQKLVKDDSDGHLGDLSDAESSTSGSNSTESDGLPAHLLNISDKSHNKRKTLKSRKERNRSRQVHVEDKESKNTQIHGKFRHEPFSEETIKDKIPEKMATVKTKTKQVERIASQTVRSWIPHPTPRIGVIGHLALWEQEPKKDSYLEVMTAPDRNSASPFSRLLSASDNVARTRHHHVPVQLPVPAAKEYPLMQISPMRQFSVSFNSHTKPQLRWYSQRLRKDNENRTIKFVSRYYSPAAKSASSTGIKTFHNGLDGYTGLQTDTLLSSDSERRNTASASEPEVRQGTSHFSPKLTLMDPRGKRFSEVTKPGRDLDCFRTPGLVIYMEYIFINWNIYLKLIQRCHSLCLFLQVYHGALDR
ncbi:cytosolic carboxypeptidase 2 isoform X2 [Denticeps clupeoides]|uniref:cytosolic carboxypeptidase 2 isoform X2 n=1 Tax=Denticeps clupeoides TaxID=299321 RepID=UPI0010A55C37|nr:cytosolic carboxypeptidase 2 isoform X2 [Denticeps clupeoides]